MRISGMLALGDEDELLDDWRDCSQITSSRLSSESIFPAPAVSSDARELLEPPDGLRAGSIEDSSPPPAEPDRRLPLPLPLLCCCCCCWLADCACSIPVCSTRLQLFGTLIAQRLW
uniref:Uncharacterized protein n=1 Tax=Anopheles coluzzii TaxID=1518534 RepID=A0A8W7PPM0_ANOCL